MIELKLLEDGYYTNDRKWAVLKNLDGVYFLYKLDSVGFYQYHGIKDRDIDYIKNYIENH